MRHGGNLTISRRIFLLISLPSLLFSQQSELPYNLGLGLRELVELHRARPAGMLHLDLRNKAVALGSATGKPLLVSSLKRGIVSDRAGRVLTTILLDRSEPLERIRERITQGGGLIAVDDPAQPGTLVAFLNLDRVAALAEAPGISAIKLSRRPIRHAGAVTSQGVPIIHSDQVNAGGITGQGITIGIISDSFDGVTVSPTATNDVSTGDLPNMGVADGRPGLKFLNDGMGEEFGDTDEGRALAQIAFDVAPGISLCFATADFGSVGMAKSIRRLRTDSSCLADVIVDDIQYEDEPMFSDGPIALAVEDVVNSGTLAGRKVAYFSAAGNEGKGSYASVLRMVTDATARSLANPGVTLTAIPGRIDTTGGFHNFNPDPAGVPRIFQSVTLSGDSAASLVLQWDDPFDQIPSGITTDLNLLVFDTNGRYLGSFSDDNFSTNEPIELNDLPAGAYRFVIARTGRGSHLATRFQYVAFLSSAGSLEGDYLVRPQPTIYGHAAARSAQAVAAYVFDNTSVASAITPSLEFYSSTGPVTIAFDAAGNRLATVETRRKPDFAAPDCVNTTFFFDQNTGDPFFTFCGTSAAAPHAAGAAALLLESAGGPNSLTNEQIRVKLQASPAARDLDPFFSQAVLKSGAATVTVSATGDESSSSSPNFFHIGFSTSTAGQTLTGVTIDLGPAGLNFDPNPASGFPLTVASMSSGITVTSPSPNARSTVLTLTFSGFANNGFVDFGIDRDIAAINNGGNSADLLANAKVTATFSNGTPASGVIVNSIGTGYNPFDGFGLIDVRAAIAAK